MTGYIGINYGRKISDASRPDPVHVVALLKVYHEGVKHVRIFDADENVLKAFKGSGMKLIVAVTNEEVAKIADNERKPENSNDVRTGETAAAQWVRHKKIKFYAAGIIAIAVGNEWLRYIMGNNSRNNESYKSKLLKAMNNIYSALHDIGLSGEIKVSTPFAFEAVEGYPPSAGHFVDQHKNFVKDILSFLYLRKSDFMVNVYPFMAYADETDPQKKSNLEYVLFKKPEKHGTDVFKSLFAAMLVTLKTAIRNIDPEYLRIKIVITETGWPNGGSPARPQRGANPENARIYNQGVINHVHSEGTSAMPTYIFALFNEDLKTGGVGDEEKHFGHFEPKKLKDVHSSTEILEKRKKVKPLYDLKI